MAVNYTSSEDDLLTYVNIDQTMEYLKYVMEYNIILETLRIY